MGTTDEIISAAIALRDAIKVRGDERVTVDHAERLAKCLLSWGVLADSVLTLAQMTPTTDDGMSTIREATEQADAMHEHLMRIIDAAACYRRGECISLEAALATIKEATP